MLVMSRMLLRWVTVPFWLPPALVLPLLVPLVLLLLAALRRGARTVLAVALLSRAVDRPSTAPPVVLRLWLAAADVVPGVAVLPRLTAGPRVWRRGLRLLPVARRGRVAVARDGVAFWLPAKLASRWRWLLSASWPAGTGDRSSLSARRDTLRREKAREASRMWFMTRRGAGQQQQQRLRVRGGGGDAIKREQGAETRHAEARK